MNSYKSRKFWFANAVLVSNAVLLVFGYITADIWSTVVTAVVWGYIAGNVGEHYVKK